MKFQNVMPLIFIASVILAEAEPKPKATPKAIADPIAKADPKSSADPKPLASPKPTADPKPAAEPLLTAATKRNYESEIKEKTIFADLTSSGLTRYGQPTLITVPVKTASKGIANSFVPLYHHHDSVNQQTFQAFLHSPFNNGYGFLNAFYHPEIVTGYPTIPFNVHGTPNPSFIPAFNGPIFDQFGSNGIIVEDPLAIHPLGHRPMQTPGNSGFFGHPGFGVPLIFDQSLYNLVGFNSYGYNGATLGNYARNVNYPTEGFQGPTLKQHGFVLPNQRRFMLSQFGSQQNPPVDNVAIADTGRYHHDGPSVQYGLPGNNQF